MMSDERRVVVVGMGALSAVGNSVAECWRSLVAGKSGIAHVTRYPLDGYHCQIAGELKDFHPEEYMDPKSARRLDLFSQYALAASKEAVAQAGIPMGGEGVVENAARIGVVIGSGTGGLGTMCNQYERLTKLGQDRVSPLGVPMMISDMASGCVAQQYQFTGPNLAVVSACASGLHSIGEAFWMIRRGDADLMVTGGADATILPLMFASFGQMHALSGRNDSPETASRPFDKTRDGFVPGEGAGVLVLEEREHAMRRGAEILAEVVGYGLSADAFHMTAPRPDGMAAAAAVKRAMEMAHITAEQISYVNAHGTATPLNDKTETLVMKEALGEQAYHIPISSTKSMTGHMLGAAGSFESIVCIRALQEQLIPPTINQFEKDPDCDLDYVPNQAREIPVEYALKVSFGFGGHNAAVLFRRA